jgi:hypothetical protein
MLFHVRPSPHEKVKLESILPLPDATSRASTFATDPPSSLPPVPNETLLEVENVPGIPDHESKQTTSLELVLYSAGAIFGLILAYLLRKSRPPSFFALHAKAMLQCTQVTFRFTAYFFASSRRIPRPTELGTGIAGCSVHPKIQITGFSSF